MSVAQRSRHSKKLKRKLPNEESQESPTKVKRRRPLAELQEASGNVLTSAGLPISVKAPRNQSKEGKVMTFYSVIKIRKYYVVY